MRDGKGTQREGAARLSSAWKGPSVCLADITQIVVVIVIPSFVGYLMVLLCREFGMTCVIAIAVLPFHAAGELNSALRKPPRPRLSLEPQLPHSPLDVCLVSLAPINAE